MSKTRTVSTLAASLAILAGACWYVTGALPLSAQPQLANDSRGVMVDTMGSPLMHRAPVFYPREALAKNLEGVVVAQAKLDETGNVTDASILSGPEELRKAVLQSVLTWHFNKEAGGTTRQIAVTFRLPEAAAPPAVSSGRQSIMVTAPPVTNAAPLAVRKVERPVSEPVDSTVRSIDFEGLGLRPDEVLPKLPLHVNDVWTPESMTKLAEAMHQVDEHANVSSRRLPGGGIAVVISGPPPPPPPPHIISPIIAGAVTVGGRVQSAKLISNPQPEYPAIARQARISGTVELQALIGKDGHVQSLTVVSGHPLLRQAALDAVKNWVYEQTTLNGQAIAVQTTVDVIFSINQ